MKINIKTIKYTFKYGIRYLFDHDFRKRCWNREMRKKRQEKRGSGFLSNRKRIKRSLSRRDGCKCTWCNKYFPLEKLTIDHKIQVSVGGTNDMSNLRLLCRDCHNIKDSNLTGRYTF